MLNAIPISKDETGRVSCVRSEPAPKAADDQLPAWKSTSVADSGSKVERFPKKVMTNEDSSAWVSLASLAQAKSYGSGSSPGCAVSEPRLW